MSDRVGYTWERFVSNGLPRVLILVVLKGVKLGGGPGEGARYYIGLRIRVRLRVKVTVRVRVRLRVRLRVRVRESTDLGTLGWLGFRV